MRQVSSLMARPPEGYDEGAVGGSRVARTFLRGPVAAGGDGSHVGEHRKDRIEQAVRKEMPQFRPARLR
jgi:hypothetical protein